MYIDLGFQLIRNPIRETYVQYDSNMLIYIYLHRPGNGFKQRGRLVVTWERRPYTEGLLYITSISNVYRKMVVKEVLCVFWAIWDLFSLFSSFLKSFTRLSCPDTSCLIYFKMKTVTSNLRLGETGGTILPGLILAPSSSVVWASGSILAERKNNF